jgi:hypothetical protein
MRITNVSDFDNDGRTGLDDISQFLRGLKIMLDDSGKTSISQDGNTLTILRGNGNYKAGDFRSSECIALLKECDIVCTNPPFSIFREFVSQLMQYEKEFLIIGNQNAITYKEIFPLIKNNKLWVGFNNFDGSRFRIPSEYYNGSKYQEFKNGVLFGRVSGVRWFTNLDVQKRHFKLDLYKKYSPMEYPSYFNYFAINIDTVSEIPYDYDGEIGVPITFIDKYNPNQFEIVKFRKGDDNKDLFYIKEDKIVQPYFRIIIKQKKETSNIHSQGTTHSTL